MVLSRVYFDMAVPDLREVIYQCDWSCVVYIWHFKPQAYAGIEMLVMPEVPVKKVSLRHRISKCHETSLFRALFKYVSGYRRYSSVCNDHMIVRCCEDVGCHSGRRDKARGNDFLDSVFSSRSLAVRYCHRKMKFSGSMSGACRVLHVVLLRGKEILKMQGWE